MPPGLVSRASPIRSATPIAFSIRICWKRSALRSRLGLAHETIPGQCYHKSTVPQGSRCSMRFIISATLSNNLTTECNCLQLLWGTWTLVIPAVHSYIPGDLVDSFQILKPSGCQPRVEAVRILYSQVSVRPQLSLLSSSACFPKWQSHVPCNLRKQKPCNERGCPYRVGTGT